MQQGIRSKAQENKSSQAYGERAIERRTRPVSGQDDKENRDEPLSLGIHAMVRRNKQAQPPWANQKQINRVYMLAKWGSRFSDEPLEVDHIILDWDGELQLAGCTLLKDLQSTAPTAE